MQHANLPHGLEVAIASGFFGASFFMLIQLQQKLSEGNVNDLRDSWTYRMIILRCIVGIGAASILYFFFKSGLLQGNLWPELNKVGCEKLGDVPRDSFVSCSDVGASQIVPNESLALLVVWSFLAGYSQSLVPNLLLRTEGQAGGGEE